MRTQELDFDGTFGSLPTQGILKFCEVTFSGSMMFYFYIPLEECYQFIADTS